MPTPPLSSPEYQLVLFDRCRRQHHPVYFFQQPNDEEEPQHLPPTQAENPMQQDPDLNGEEPQPNIPAGQTETGQCLTVLRCRRQQHPVYFDLPPNDEEEPQDLPPVQAESPMQQDPDLNGDEPQPNIPAGQTETGRCLTTVLRCRRQQHPVYFVLQPNDEEEPQVQAESPIQQDPELNGDDPQPNIPAGQSTETVPASGQPEIITEQRIFTSHIGEAHSKVLDVIGIFNAAVSGIVVTGFTMTRRSISVLSSRDECKTTANSMQEIVRFSLWSLFAFVAAAAIAFTARIYWYLWKANAEDDSNYTVSRRELWTLVGFTYISLCAGVVGAVFLFIFLIFFFQVCLEQPDCHSNSLEFVLTSGFAFFLSVSCFVVFVVIFLRKHGIERRLRGSRRE